MNDLGCCTFCDAEDVAARLAARLAHIAAVEATRIARIAEETRLAAAARPVGLLRRFLPTGLLSPPPAAALAAAPPPNTFRYGWVSGVAVRQGLLTQEEVDDFVKGFNNSTTPVTGTITPQIQAGIDLAGTITVPEVALGINQILKLILDLGTDANTFKCNVCLSDIPFSEAISNGACRHVMCVDCITEWGRERNGRVPTNLPYPNPYSLPRGVPCPTCRAQLLTTTVWKDGIVYTV